MFLVKHNYLSVSSHTFIIKFQEEVSVFYRNYIQQSTPLTDDIDTTKLCVDKNLRPFILITPQFSFDCSENCVDQPIIKKSRLPLVEDNETQLNRTKLFAMHQI